MYDNILKLIKSIMNNKTEEIVLSKQDEFMLKEQALLPFVYYSSKNLEFKKYYVSACISDELFNNAKTDLCVILNDNNIDFIIFKGMILKEFYPDQALRTKGDIDIYVGKKNYKKAIKCLLDNKYELCDDETDYHIGFIKSGISIEIHSALLTIVSEYYYFFKDPFKHTINNENHQFYLDDTYHFEFLIAHYAKHLIYGGAGIRPIIDFYFMLEHGKVDTTKAYNDLKKLGLHKLFESMSQVIYLIINDEKYNKNKNVDDFLDFIMNSGVHGFGINNNMMQNQISRMGRMKYALHKIFPSNKEMKNLYPRMYRCRLLYPICWFRRFFQILFFRNRKIKESFDCDKEDSLKRKRMYDDIGLK